MVYAGAKCARGWRGREGDQESAMLNVWTTSEDVSLLAQFL